MQFSYVMGVAKPVTLLVETYGTEQGKLTADDTTHAVKITFNLTIGVKVLTLQTVRAGHLSLGSELVGLKSPHCKQFRVGTCPQSVLG